MLARKAFTSQTLSIRFYTIWISSMTSSFIFLKGNEQHSYNITSKHRTTPQKAGISATMDKSWRGLGGQTWNSTQSVICLPWSKMLLLSCICWEFVFTSNRKQKDNKIENEKQLKKKFTYMNLSNKTKHWIACFIAIS